MRAVRLEEMDLPDFGMPTVEPRIPAETYADRIEAAHGRAKARGLDVLLVYADREHAANLAYLTGYDPRFEEALLVLAPGRTPALMVGNEGFGYAAICPIEVERILWQGFSLLDQPRGSSRPLDAVLSDLGIGRGARVGIAGWKYFRADECADAERWIEAPSYLVDVVRALVGDAGRVVNATDLFMNPADGLRAINDVDQLAAFEFAATHTSQALRNVLFGLRPGMTEYEAVRLMQLNGLPWSCHLMLSAGPRAALGLPSPSMRPIGRGEPMTMAYGVWGALNARAGFVVEDASGLPEDVRDYVDRLVAPYFRAIVRWYETVGIGVEGRVLYDLIHEELGDPFFGITLNPGHLIHLDEWVSSPIAPGSTIPLASGMALQVDVIPATGTRYFTTNIEDGIALADGALRQAFRDRHPEAWSRIEARRRFMADVLGIRLKPEVLPFSNIPAYLPPYLLNPRLAMRAS